MDYEHSNCPACGTPGADKVTDCLICCPDDELSCWQCGSPKLKLSLAGYHTVMICEECSHEMHCPQ